MYTVVKRYNGHNMTLTLDVPYLWSLVEDTFTILKRNKKVVEDIKVVNFVCYGWGTSIWLRNEQTGDEDDVDIYYEWYIREFKFDEWCVDYKVELTKDFLSTHTVLRTELQKFIMRSCWDRLKNPNSGLIKD